jgi:Mg2+-importing ATPase
MLFYLCPKIMGLPTGLRYGIWNPSGFGDLTPDQQIQFMAIFQAGWFIESLWTQTLVIHMIRTPKVPFIQSRASWKVAALTLLGIAVGTALPFTPLGKIIGMNHFGKYTLTFFGLLIASVAAYMVLVTFVKKAYVKKYGELL